MMSQSLESILSCAGIEKWGTLIEKKEYGIILIISGQFILGGIFESVKNVVKFIIVELFRMSCLILFCAMFFSLIFYWMFVLCYLMLLYLLLMDLLLLFYFRAYFVVYN